MQKLETFTLSGNPKGGSDTIKLCVPSSFGDWLSKKNMSKRAKKGVKVCLYSRQALPSIWQIFFYKSQNSNFVPLTFLKKFSIQNLLDTLYLASCTFHFKAFPDWSHLLSMTASYFGLGRRGTKRRKGEFNLGKEIVTELENWRKVRSGAQHPLQGACEFSVAGEPKVWRWKEQEIGL